MDEERLKKAFEKIKKDMDGIKDKMITKKEFNEVINKIEKIINS